MIQVVVWLARCVRYALCLESGMIWLRAMFARVLSNRRMYRQAARSCCIRHAMPFHPFKPSQCSRPILFSVCSFPEDLVEGTGRYGLGVRDRWRVDATAWRLPATLMLVEGQLGETSRGRSRSANASMGDIMLREGVPPSSVAGDCCSRRAEARAGSHGVAR